MTDTYPFLIYLAVMAGVTYLVRMLPLVLIRKKITNRFLLSFLYYMPFAVLTVMTIPACFYATGNTVTAICGFVVALILAYFGKSLLLVASAAVVTALASNYVLLWLGLL